MPLPSWTSPHPCMLSLNTGVALPASYSKFPRPCFPYADVYVSVLLFQFVPPFPSPTVSTNMFSLSAIEYFKFRNIYLFPKFSGLSVVYLFWSLSHLTAPRLFFKHCFSALQLFFNNSSIINRTSSSLASATVCCLCYLLSRVITHIPSAPQCTQTNALPTLSSHGQSYSTSSVCWMGRSIEISTWGLELEQLLTTYNLQAKYSPPSLFIEPLLEQMNELCSW